MKKEIKYYVLIATMIFMAACTSDDNENGNPNDLSGQINEIENMAGSGSWVVASFIDSGVDETNDFNDYVFTFNPEGTIVASNGANQVEGTWSITGDDSDSSDDDSMDDSSDDIDFNIFFSAPNDFSELTEDWEIISITANRMELRHISGGDGSTDTLVFEKN